MMEAVMNGAWAKSVPKTYDVQDYVGWGTSDMLCCYDGIRNAGVAEEHDTGLSSWVDLVSGNALTKNGTLSWDENSRVCSGGYEYRYISPEMVAALNGQNYTVEFVMKANSNTGSDWLCIGNNNGSIRDRFQGLTSGICWYIQNSPGYNEVWRTNYSFADILHFCAMQDTATEGRLFYNGAKNSISRTFTAPYWSTSEKFVIANEPQSNVSYSLRGNVYAVRMYGRALTDAEAAHNYAVDKARFNLP